MALIQAGHGSTQAYWRFEEATSGAVPAGSTGGSVTNTVLDASGNGNHMQTWTTGTAPSYISNVFPTSYPGNGVEISRAQNFASLDFPGSSRDIYTSNKPLNTKPFSAWTIEASFCLDTLNRWQVVVGKDGNPVGSQAPVTIKVRADNTLEVGLIDGSGAIRNVVGTLPLTANTWYHVAVTASSSTMMLYLKPQSSNEYLFLGSATINGAFFNSYTAFNQPWVVGRGMWNGRNVDWLDGRIDEVRISDTALLPSQFLGSTQMVDQDVDGLPDDWELAHGLSTDPVTGGLDGNGLNGDSDNDGLTNFQEWQKQSSPTAYTYQNMVVGENISIENSLSSGAFGSSSSVTGGGSTFLFGDDNVATNQYAGFIAGSENKLWSPSAGPGDSNILLGSKNTINPDPATAGSNIFGSVLMGLENTTSQSQSWVLGMGNVGQTNTVILGTYNAEVWGAALIVGNGIGMEYGERSNGLVVLKDGTVEIPSGSLRLGNDTAVSRSEMGSYLGANGFLQNQAINQGSLGVLGLAMGVNATAIGNNAGAWATGCTAIGYQAKAQYGSNASAIGSEAQAAGSRSTAIGYQSEARGWDSAALGSYTYAKSLGEVAVGAFNYRHPGAVGSWIATDMQFVVGNGTSAQDYSNALEVQKNGRTSLINKYWDANAPTAVPTNATEASNGEALSVEGHAVMRGNTILKGDTVLEGKVTLAQPQGDISMGVYQ
ncbi:MAG TPA: LamG-like jellyroll fold domain-containing protein [Opitutaceae bacterium]